MGALGLLLVAFALVAAAALASAQEAPAAPSAAAEEPAPSTLSLEQAIELALKHNPTAAIAEQGVWAARGLVTQAVSALAPRLDVSAQRVTPVNLPPFSFQSSNSSLETTFSISQPLFTAGSLQKGVRAAGDYLHGSEGNYQRTRQQIAYLVRQTYYGVLTAEEGVKVIQEVLSSARESLRVARVRYEAGVAPQYDVLAAEARLARVEQELIAAESARDTGWAALGTVLGVAIPPDTGLTTPRPAETSPQRLTDLQTEALAKRPDLRTSAAQVAVARAQLAIARAARWPTVSAAATYSLRPKTTIPGESFGLPPGTELIVSQSGGYIVLAASWSLYNGGQVFGSIRTAEARLRQAEQAVASLKLQINLDIQTAYLSLEAARAQVPAARKEVDQAQEAQRIARLRYQEGVGTSIEILDADANLEGAKTRLNQAIFGLNLAAAQLELAAGREVVTALETAAPPVESGSG